MKKHLLIIAFTWPEPTTTAAGVRMLQLIHFFQERDYHITIASTAAETEFSLDTSAIGISTKHIVLNDVMFDKFLTELNPDVVLFDRFLMEEQFGWRVAEHAPHAIRILDTEDLHSLRKYRETCHKKAIPFHTDAWLANDLTKREVASLYRSDISLIISSYEMQLLKSEMDIRDSLLLHLPFIVEPLSPIEMEQLPSFQERKDFICIGNGKHAPNVDAVLWLKNEIWPLIRKQLPNANLHIYGAYLPEYIQRLHSVNEGFLIQGWAPDSNAVLQKARINLAPLRFGAGLKGKLLEAMSCGTPSITTLIGAEGMHNGLEWNGAIHENTEEFAESAVAIYLDEERWLRAQKNGYTLREQFHKEIVFDKFEKALLNVASNLEQHRKQNFIGSLLRHQTMMSTKYLSKWIEEKNKKGRD